MSQYLSEAFKRLDILNEDTFAINDQGLDDYIKFEDEDELDDYVDVIDPEAETIDDVQDSYVGKVILDCCVCHSKIYKDVEDVVVDGELANAGEECPFCYTPDGYKVVGQVSEFNADETEEDDDVEVDIEETDDQIEEGLFNKKEKDNEKYDVWTTQDGETWCGAEGVDKKNADARIKEFNKKFAKEIKAGTHKIWMEPAGSGTNKKDKQIDKNKDINEAVKKVKTDAEEQIRKVPADRTLPTKSIKEDLKFNLFQDPYKGLESRISELDNSIQKARNEIDRLEKEKSKYQDSLSAEQHCQEVIKDFLNGIDIEVYYYNYIHQSKSLIVQTDYSEGTLKELKDTFSGSDVETDHNSYKKFVGEFKGHKVEVNYNESDGIIIKIRDFDDFTKSVNESKSIKESSDSGYWYFTRHGVQPGSIPKGANVLTIQDVENGTYVKLDRVLTTKELNDYEIIEKRPEGLDESKSINEDINNLSLDTDDTHMEMTSDENGKVTISTEPITNGNTDGEVITPVEPEVQNEIDSNVADGEEIEIDMDEFDEESFDNLGESYLKKVYENVNSFKCSNVRFIGDKLIVEGLINFASGNTKKTNFVFGAREATKSGKIRFIGENKEIARGKKSFTVTGKIVDKKFLSESLNYNYGVKTSNGKVQRLYGTVR